jgi:hypothetical protein
MTVSQAAKPATSPATQTICVQGALQVCVVGCLRAQGGAESIMWVGIEDCSCGLAPEDQTGQAYNEQAFRHFLTIERKRAARASRSFLLLLVSLRKVPGQDLTINAKAASRLFSGLALSVREVDFIGWYRQERVAGAVLTQGLGIPEPAAVRAIGERVTQVLGRSLSTRDAQRLQVRVLQLSRRPKRWVR